MAADNKINVTNLILIGIIIGMLIYFNECKETDYLTKREGKALAEKSEESIEMLYNLFEALNTLDSSRVINEYYTTIYKSSKNEKDSIIKSNPALADSLYLFWIHKLRTDTAYNAFNSNYW